ncbi:hypothetical protein [Metaclostridioides mangenotii]|uniref:hypothetical protein n=1 Tax=Metaclostridioides mangenotii TaxID=1540 RepID=UPI00163A2237|nr:hypothetical protein [Clostridioides mangenotii]
MRKKLYGIEHRKSEDVMTVEVLKETFNIDAMIAMDPRTGSQLVFHMILLINRKICVRRC